MKVAAVGGMRGLLAAQLSLLATAQVAVPPGFEGHLRCPFAKVWLKHGAERAAEILGVSAHVQEARRLADAVWGTCNYSNPFAGNAPMCMELTGSGWTQASATARCNNAIGTTAGILAQGARCQTGATLAGWCGTAGMTEMTMSQLSPGTDTCEKARTSCVTWSSGTFVPAGQCAQSSTVNATSSWGNSTGNGSFASLPPCMLAPGPIGAAHQMALSMGYSFDCAGTPAQRSPYMWPLRWSADVEAKSLKFGSDEVQFESRGQVWYMLDKNWKRFDIYYQKGVQRALGQTPCDNKENGTSFGCVRDGDVNRTVLHRNNKMYFIDWTADGNIGNCSWTDLQVIGNIRPDWFLDNRGDSTDVQYLGDSHVYYQSEPKLVKQWRKKDFANQYFTMSVQRLPGKDGVNWPLILNIPGEGFGDDSLQHYSGHRLLNESDSHLFLLDVAHVAAGGSCPKVGASDAAFSGPPTGQQDHVPSNLELDTAAWRPIVWTGSPVWQPPSAPNTTAQAPGQLDLGGGIRAEACYDTAASLARVTTLFPASTPVWAAVAFLKSEECLMTPRGGGDGEAVYALPDGSGIYSVQFGPLPAAMRKGGDARAMLGNRIETLTQATGFKAGTVGLSSGILWLGFARSYTTRPSSLPLSYAIGSSGTLSSHVQRGCFIVKDMPDCPVLQCSASRGTLGGTTGQVPGPVSASRHAAAGAVAVLLAAVALPLVRA